MRVLRYFESNATAYVVMDYEQGDPLKTVLQLDPQPPEAKLKAWLAPLLDGLAAVHATGFLHRDIKPDNIFIRADGKPVLIDFGAARQAIGGATKSLTSILTPGYAPLEQYSGEGKQGPWTDLYAMGGVLYRAVVEQEPARRGEPHPRRSRWARASPRRAASTARASCTRSNGRSRWTRRSARRTWRTGESSCCPTLRSRKRCRPGRGPSWPAKHRPGRAAKRRLWPYVVGVVMLACSLRRCGARTGRTGWRPSSSSARRNAGPAQARTSSSASARPPTQEFRAADSNNDGFLSQDEMRPRFPYLAKEFQRVDRDGDGRVSQSEYFQAKRLMMERKFAK